VVLVKGKELDRYYIENEAGIRLVLFKFDSPTKRGVEIFEYQAGDLTFELIASRVNQETFVVEDQYAVELGIALQIASIHRPPDFMTPERARDIATKIREAMLVWRYPPRYADVMSCHSSARGVVFNMAGWQKWDHSLEGFRP